MKATKKAVKSYAQNAAIKTKSKVKSYVQKVVPLALTPAEYGGLQEAYDFFNTELFGGGELPNLFITYQRRAHSRGYYSADRFSSRGITAARHDELALNPDAFIARSDQEIASTLVHEQTHVWQHHFGKPAARGYHNKQWATKMKAIGLQPSNTGAVGGRETGSQMTHYIIPGGLFEKVFAKLAAKGWKLNLQSAHGPGPKRAIPNSKTKFTCPLCHQNAWGKPDLQMLCLLCTREAFNDIIASRLTDADDIAAAERSRDLITGHAQMRAEVTEAPVLDRTNDYGAEAAE